MTATARPCKDALIEAMPTKPLCNNSELRSRRREMAARLSRCCGSEQIPISEAFKKEKKKKEGEGHPYMTYEALAEKG